MLEEPQANIKVELSIPPQKILGAVQQTMFKYGEIVEEAMQEVALDLNFNEAFQEKVKFVVKEEIKNSLKKAIEDCGIKARSIAFRGGTDGSALSFRGLPCPNLSALVAFAAFQCPSCSCLQEIEICRTSSPHVICVCSGKPLLHVFVLLCRSWP